MTKVVVSRFEKPTKAGGTAVAEKRIRDPDGKVRTLRTLDAGSSTFGSDLQYVFGKNVAKARRENKRVTGSTDIAVAKR